MFCTQTDFTLHALHYMIQTNISHHQVSPFLLTIRTLMSQMINWSRYVNTGVWCLSWHWGHWSLTGVDWDQEKSLWSAVAATGATLHYWHWSSLMQTLSQVEQDTSVLISPVETMFVQVSVSSACGQYQYQQAAHVDYKNTIQFLWDILMLSCPEPELRSKSLTWHGMIMIAADWWR